VSVASQRMFVVVFYSFIDPVLKLLDTPSYFSFWWGQTISKVELLPAEVQKLRK